MLNRYCDCRAGLLTALRPVAFKCRIRLDTWHDPRLECVVCDGRDTVRDQLLIEGAESQRKDRDDSA